MKLHYTEYGIFYELTSQCERDDFVQFFFNKIDDVITNQHHPHKYQGPKQIERILNSIADDLELELIFKYKPYSESWSLYAKDIDVNFLDEVFKEFKTVYRHKARDFCV